MPHLGHVQNVQDLRCIPHCQASQSLSAFKWTSCFDTHAQRHLLKRLHPRLKPSALRNPLNRCGRCSRVGCGTSRECELSAHMWAFLSLYPAVLPSPSARRADLKGCLTKLKGYVNEFARLLDESVFHLQTCLKALQTPPETPQSLPEKRRTLRRVLNKTLVPDSHAY